RTDIFALGVIAFELLSGVLPVDVKGLSATEAVRRVLVAEPRKLRTLVPGLHADIYTIVAKAMHADAGMRYSSAAELGRDVRRFLSHQPILARRPSPGYVVSRFVRRHRALTTLGVSALAMLVASLLVMAYLWTDATRTRADAIWQSYRASMSAASVDLAAGDVASARAALEATPAKPRGWEYRHFVSRLDESIHAITTPQSGSWSILPESHDTALLISTDDLKRIDLASGKLSATQPDQRLRLYYGAKASTFPGFMEWSGSSVFSPGGPTGVVEHRVAGWPDWPFLRVISGAVSRDNQHMVLILTSHDRNEVVLVDLASGESSTLGLGPLERVLRVGLSSDGSRLILAASDTESEPQQLRLLDTRTMRELARTDALERPVHALAMEPQTNRLVIMLQSGELQRWSIDEDRLTLLQRAAFDQDAAQGLSFSADGSKFACGSRDGLVRVFHTESLAMVSEQRGHEREIVSVACVPVAESGSPHSASSLIVSSAMDGRVRLWDWSPHNPSLVSLRGHQHLVHALAYGPDSRRVWTGSWDKSISLYNPDTGERLATASTSALVLTLALSHDERVVASRELGGAVRIWDAVTLRLLESVPVMAELLDVPAFDESDTYVILEPPMQDDGFRAWNRHTQRVERLPRSAIRRFSAPWINPTAGLYAVTMQRGARRMSILMDIETGDERFVLPTVRAADESIAFTPDGSAFAAPGPDHTITLYSAQSFEAIGEFRGHTREVLATVFSPDGSRLFSADLTGVIRVWDTSARQEVAQLRGHRAHLRRLIVTPDGLGLLSGGRDGEARVWWAPGLQ
ncbi:MAG TPA: hypothetical protein VK157_15285, partial [Phycisphaerales bacterium]|nr:hypothetical protein [Phycisphaerales bacterium]